MQQIPDDVLDLLKRQRQIGIDFALDKLTTTPLSSPSAVAKLLHESMRFIVMATGEVGRPQVTSGMVQRMSIAHGWAIVHAACVEFLDHNPQWGDESMLSAQSNAALQLAIRRMHTVHDKVEADVQRGSDNASHSDRTQ